MNHFKKNIRKRYKRKFAYIARQMIYENKGVFVGFYALTQGIATILPFRPKISDENLQILGSKQVLEWQISLIITSKKRILELNYTKFIKNLPRQKYKFIDENKILVSRLSASRLKRLAFVS